MGETSSFNFADDCTAYWAFEKNPEFITHCEAFFQPIRLSEIGAETYSYLPLSMRTQAGTRMVLTETDLHDYPCQFLRAGKGSRLESCFPKEILERTLLSKLQGTALTDHVIFITEGNIKPTTGVITLKDNTKFKMFGGYPTGLTGTATTERDINRYMTSFAGKDRSGDKDNARLFVYNGSAAGTETLFDGIGFNDTYQWVEDKQFDMYTGTCLLIGAAKKVYCVNCRFNNNYKVGNAIIRVGSTSSTVSNAEFERCSFANNTVTGDGLIRVYPNGKLTLEDCDFTENNKVLGANSSPYRICFASNTADVTDGGGNKLAADQKLK